MKIKMTKAREEYLEYEICNGLNPAIHKYVIELEQQKAELMECLNEVRNSHSLRWIQNRIDEVLKLQMEN